MLVCQLLGGNEIKGIKDGVVIIDGEKLGSSYRELQSICGSISLGSIDTRKGEKAIQRDYIQSVKELGEEIDSEKFVIKNHLTSEVCYSSYEVDFEAKTLTLEISIY